jgi:hypothetical protein
LTSHLIGGPFVVDTQGRILHNYNSKEKFLSPIELGRRGLDCQDVRSNFALIQFAIYGKRDEAVRLFQSVLKINPNHASAIRKLQLLERTER